MPKSASGLIAMSCFLFSGINAHAEKIVSQSAIRFSYSLPGETVEVKKVLDDDRKVVRITSNSMRIKSAEDLVALENKEAKAIRLRFGALDERLQRKFDHMKESDVLDIEVSLIDNPLVILDKTRHSEEELKQHTFKMLTRPPKINLKGLLEKYGLNDAEGMNGRTFRAKVTRSKLKALMFDPDMVRSQHLLNRLLFNPILRSVH